MTIGYRQFCPVAKAAELLCERWTLLVARELIAGSRHFNELRRGLPRMSPTLLSTRLSQLVASGVIRRSTEGPTQHAYELTQAGQELVPLIETMGVWGHRWVSKHLHDNDLDAGLLMWDIGRGVDSSVLPERRVVIEVELTDAPRDRRHWWLVSEAEHVDLCLEDPGHEVDLLIRATVRMLTSVWMCRLSLDQARRSGDITLSGPERLKRLMPRWLIGSPLARLGAQSLVARPIET
ncbi:MAG: helix-turn-helix transcriptional regulator [Proteobacteria bacterium]|nr:helix-turn-helix transcriptional regulator [Pseudomonadota bacterium]